MDATKRQKIANWLGSGSINIFGMPFAGKDTQGKILAEELDGILLSSGDILRHDHGIQEVHDIMAAGGIIPSELFNRIVVPFLAREELAGKPLILSEVGRVDGEAQVILEATRNTRHETKAVVLLRLSDDEVWRRFRESQSTHDRGVRADDNENVLQRRLDSYKQKVLPVIEYYRSLNLLIEIDGSQDRENVTRTIFDELATRADNDDG
jgi:adenylate kinase